jgi:CheY-like chemotaxis protein
MPVPQRVLIVDDESHILLYTRLILKALGVPEILTAARGEEALAIFERTPPQLVLMDINMPGTTGIEVLQAMTASNPDIPVVMLTGQASREAVEVCRDAGACFFIRKDTPREEIMSLLRDLFARLGDAA